MSRIDEAWRRVPGGDAGPNGPSIAVADRPFSQGLSLHGYAPEPGSGPSAPAGPEAPAEPAVHVAEPAALSFDEKLVVRGQIPPVSIEQYRRLAAVLEQAQAENGLKSVLISSALPREGKTLTAANLALTLSEGYRRRVLLIDADMRRPRTHALFGIRNESGLSDLLRDTNRPLVASAVTPTLSVLTAGRNGDSPVAGLSSSRMHALMTAAVAQYDWVLLDTPPVGLLTDAQLVARVTNAVLLVIAAGVTPYGLVQRTIEELGADRIIGTVLNRMAPDALPSGDYYGRYYDTHEDSRG